MKKNIKGFSLIELLAVLVILALLAMITSPIIMQLINSAQESSRVRSVEAYAKAVQLALATEELDVEDAQKGEIVLAAIRCTDSTCDETEDPLIWGKWTPSGTIPSNAEYIDSTSSSYGALFFYCRGFNNVDTYKKPDGTSDGEEYLTGQGVCYSDSEIMSFAYSGTPVMCGDMRYNRNDEGYLEMTNCRVGNTDQLYYYNNDPNPGDKYKMKYDHLPIKDGDQRTDTYNNGARVPNKFTSGKAVRTGTDFVDWSPDN